MLYEDEVLRLSHPPDVGHNGFSVRPCRLGVTEGTKALSVSSDGQETVTRW